MSTYLEDHIAALPENEFRTWSLNSLVLKMLEPTGNVLDYGCGSGQLLKRILKQDVKKAFGAEVSGSLIKVATQQCPNATIFNPLAKKIPKNLDVIYSLDVIEHIENDREVLNNFYKSLKPGGKVLIAVPAHQILFSDFDTELGHYRRYEQAELLLKLKDAGFEDIKLRWWNRLGLSVVKYQLAHSKERAKTLREQRSFSQILSNSLLLWWFRLVENPIAPGDGLTLIATACKPK